MEKENKFENKREKYEVRNIKIITFSNEQTQMKKIDTETDRQTEKERE